MFKPIDRLSQASGLPITRYYIFTQHLPSVKTQPACSCIFFYLCWQASRVPPYPDLNFAKPASQALLPSTTMVLRVPPFAARQLVSRIAFDNGSRKLQGRKNDCGVVTLGQPGTYGAAAGDLSPDISGGLCPGNTDMGNCNGQVPVAGYVAPSCPTGNCGLCYSVTNQGGVDGGSIGGVGQSVIVQIIDSCPSQNAYNYCKTDVPAEQRCESSSLNAMDIDQAAYQALTGQPFGSVSAPLPTEHFLC